MVERKSLRLLSLFFSYSIYEYSYNTTCWLLLLCYKDTDGEIYTVIGHA